jgi:dienelactone hydrolase
MPQPRGPHEYPFVVDVPLVDTIVDQHADFDVYRPKGQRQPLPAVLFVPGPVPDVAAIRPTRWPLYRGYARLAASRGLVGVVLAPNYHSMDEWRPAAADLPVTVEAARALAEIDDTRVALWAFSAGALLMGRWLEESPPWLRCLALSYPVLRGPRPAAADETPDPADVVRPGRPVILTRVGLEQEDWAASVEAFLARAGETGTTTQVIEVPDGHHGFDVADHDERSRHAVLAAIDAVAGFLS